MQILLKCSSELLGNLFVLLGSHLGKRGKQKPKTIKTTRGGRPMARQMTRRGSEKFAKHQGKRRK